MKIFNPKAYAKKPRKWINSIILLNDRFYPINYATFSKRGNFNRMSRIVSRDYRYGRYRFLRIHPKNRISSSNRKYFKWFNS